MATMGYIDLPVEGGGVTSLNGETGALTLVPGTGITITPSGSTITIASTGGGTVTSVGLSSPGILYTVSGSPVTTSGTLTLNLIAQTENTVLAGPTSGGAANPSFRLLVPADIPNISGSKVTGFTSGSVIFADSTGALAQDNANFFWNDTTFNLGLGIIPATNVAIDILNTSGSSKAIQQTGYGTGSTPVFRGRFAEGTSTSPSAVLSGDILAVFAGRGYGTSQFSSTSTGILNIVAGETFTNTSNATYLQFEVTPTGSVTATEVMRVNSTGNVLIGTTTDSGTQKLQINGNSNVGTVTAGLWNGTNTSGVTIITSGTTYTTPATITTATIFKITVIGGGGGGGGVNGSNTGAPGGGGGCTGLVWLTGLSPSTAYAVTIGAGGAGGANTGSTAGAPGGGTAILINSVLYTANGGGGSPALSGNTNGGGGGLGTNFQLELIGGNGGSSTSSPAGVPSGAGGNAPMWGIGGATTNASGNGINGRGFGGGGSGAHGVGAGGNGAQGAIIIEWQN